MANQGQSHFFNDSFKVELCCVLCKCTCPNSISCYLKPKLHPNCCFQVMILQLLDLLFLRITLKIVSMMRIGHNKGLRDLWIDLRAWWLPLHSYRNICFMPMKRISMTMKPLESPAQWVNKHPKKLQKNWTVSHTETFLYNVFSKYQNSTHSWTWYQFSGLSVGSSQRGCVNRHCTWDSSPTSWYKTCHRTSPHLPIGDMLGAYHSNLRISIIQQ